MFKEVPFCTIKCAVNRTKTVMSLSVVRFRRPGLKLRLGRWGVSLRFHAASCLAHVGSCFLWGKAMGGLS